MKNFFRVPSDHVSLVVVMLLQSSLYGRLCYCALPQYAWYCATWEYSCRGFHFLISYCSRRLSWRQVTLFTISESKMAENIKMAADQLFISWFKLFTQMCLQVNNFFRVLNDYECKYGCKAFCGCLYYSHLCMVVFVLRIASPQYK